MSDPAQYFDYDDYLKACVEANEIPVSLVTWLAWKYPPVQVVDGRTLEQRVIDLERRMDELEGGK